MEQTLYHVQLEGRTVGPYDRRTIIGMRIKKTLASADVLIGADGSRLTVIDLIGKQPDFNPSRSGRFSRVQATYAAALEALNARGTDIPLFRGEIEARVQGEVLRLAGRYRRLFAWSEGRVKIALKDVVHARIRGSLVDMWLHPRKGDRLHQLTLELFTPENAGAFVDWLPQATPYPGDEAMVRSALPLPTALLVAGLGALLAVSLVLMALLKLR